MDRNVRERGFTLIELVVVITILGILAAFAVPRFVALDAQARAASMEALGGSVRSAAALAHSMWLATNQSPVQMEGANIAVVNGYPTRASIDNALVDLTQQGFAYSAATGQFRRQGTSVAAAATCNVTYTPPAALGDPPQVSVTTTDC